MSWKRSTGAKAIWYADGKACLHFLNPGEVPEALSGLRRVPDHCPGLLQYSRSPERMGQCNRAGFDAGSGKCFIHSERNLPGCYSIRRRIGSYRANRRISLSTWGRWGGGLPAFTSSYPKMRLLRPLPGNSGKNIMEGERLLRRLWMEQRGPRSHLRCHEECSASLERGIQMAPDYGCEVYRKMAAVQATGGNL